MTHARLTDAKLSRANLFSCDFTDAVLTGADLTHANLDGSVLRRADLRKANLEGASLFATIIEAADLSGANLSGTRIIGYLRGAKLVGATLTKANIGADPGNQSMGVMRATFISADLSGADFTGANLFKADFSHATLAGARSRAPNLSNSELVQTDLTRADLTGAKLAQANLDGADFTGAIGVDRRRGSIRPAIATRRSSMRNDLTRLRRPFCCSPPVRAATRPRAMRPEGRPRTRRPARRPRAAGSGGLVAYVTNEGSEELTVIDTRTDSAIATIPVGTRPRGVRVSRDGRTVFVALSGSPKCPPTMPDEECEKLKSDKTQGRDRGGGRGQPGRSRACCPAARTPRPSTSAGTAPRCSSRTRTPGRRRSWTSRAARSARR